MGKKTTKKTEDSKENESPVESNNQTVKEVEQPAPPAPASVEVVIDNPAPVDTQEPDTVEEPVEADVEEPVEDSVEENIKEPVAVESEKPKRKRGRPAKSVNNAPEKKKGGSSNILLIVIALVVAGVGAFAILKYMRSVREAKKLASQ